MADIKLDFAWEVTTEGGIEVQLTPSNSPDTIIGSFMMDEAAFMNELAEDITEFELGVCDDSVFNDWEDLADFFSDLADQIKTKVNEAKYQDEADRHNLIEKLKRMKIES